VVTTRVAWDSLSDTALSAVEAHTGPITSVEPVSDGLNSELAVILRTTDDMTFVKGLRADHPRVWTQNQEKAINPYVRTVSPALRWSVDTDEWNILGFDYLTGHRANYAPGSPDLMKVVDSLRRLQDLPCPPAPMKVAERRWASFADDPMLFAGDHLLHTEWSSSNILVGDTAFFVDWAWPTRGAAWIDPACWIVWLVASGHSPRSAEEWASKIPSWTHAPLDSVIAFADAQSALWRGIADADPEPWIEGVASAARRWSAYRRALAGDESPR
jgi:hypothetical protein